ncbi:MAG: hypothetical protein WCH46_09465 [bacterium]
MMKRTILFSALLALSLFPRLLSAQTFEWAHSGSSSVIATAAGLATDSKGFIYATGTFYGNIEIGSTKLTAIGRDVYVAKYDVQGNALWAKRAGGERDEFSYAIAVDKNGDCIICGSFYDHITFGGDTITSRGQHDIFIAKYSTNGDLIWAKTAGGKYADHAVTLSLDKSGNIYVGGFFKDTMWFGSNVTITTKRNQTFDMFIAKFNPSGDISWAKEISGSPYYYTPDDGLAIVAEPNGSLYVVGSFQQSAQFDTTIITNNASYGFFLAEYSATGKLVTLKSSSKDGSMITGRRITIDKKGNLYIAGTYTVNAIFGDHSLISNNLGNMELFVTKYDPKLNVEWAQTSSGFGMKQPTAITTDEDGNLLVAGLFRDTAIFGPSTISTAGTESYFLVKYDIAGKPLWAKQGGRHGASSAHGLALDKQGNVYLQGKFTDTAEFGRNRLIANLSTQDFSLAKLSPRMLLKEKKIADVLPAEFKFVSCDINKSSALVRFTLPKPAFVTLGIYSEVGDVMESYIEGQREAGVYEDVLDIKGIGSGEYYCRLQGGRDKQTKKITISH